MFTLREKNSAEITQKTWENAVQHIGIGLGQDISMKLQTRMIMVIPELIYSQEILFRHSLNVQIFNKTHARLRESR